MEVTVVFRNMMPLEALVTLVKELIDDRGLAMGSSGKFQVSIRKSDSECGASYDIRLSSGLARQSWVAVDGSPELAVRTVFERCDQALSALGASALAQVGRFSRASKLARLSH